MIYLFVVAASLILFIGFFMLASKEAQTGNRLLSGIRGHFDERVARMFFIFEHVNWTEFLSHTLSAGIARVLHDIAHLFLHIVRFIERQLTRMVRYLRDRRPNVLAPKPSRQSVFTTARRYISTKLHRLQHDESE